MAKDLSGEIAIIEGALSDIEDVLAKEAASSRSRALRAKFETYRRVVGGWERTLPNESQCATLFECVMELHDEVLRGAGKGAWRTGNRASEAPPKPSDPPTPSTRITVPAPDGELPADALPSEHPGATTAPPLGPTPRASNRPTKPPK